MKISENYRESIIAGLISGIIVYAAPIVIDFASTKDLPTFFIALISFIVIAFLMILFGGANVNSRNKKRQKM